MKRRTRQQQPGTAEQLKSGIQQEWTQIPLKNCNNQCPQFPKLMEHDGKLTLLLRLDSKNDFFILVSVE